MGTENVYLPSLFKYNTLIPVAYPILLNENGNPSILCPDITRTRKIEISSVAFSRPELEEYKKSFIGCTIEGADNVNFDHNEVLYQITKPYEPGTYHIPIRTSSKFRIIRFKIPSIMTKLNEIKFYSIDNDIEKVIKGELICSYSEDSLLLKNLVDGDKLTGVNFNSISEKHKLLNNIWIGYDFKRPVSISAVEFYFSFNVNIRIEGIYELFYWDFEWKSLGTKKSSSNLISFEHVPENALLMVKIHDTDKYSRIFTYSDGKQHWW